MEAPVRREAACKGHMEEAACKGRKEAACKGRKGAACKDQGKEVACKDRKETACNPPSAPQRLHQTCGSCRQQGHASDDDKYDHNLN